MIPVTQTIFGKGTGNCFAACIASILECPLEEVPNFCAEVPDDAPKSWIVCLAEWLEARGCGLLYLPWSSSFMTYPATNLIVSGKSPRAEPEDRGFQHSVIMRPSLGPCVSTDDGAGGLSHRYPEYRLEWVHDPHPSGAFLDGEPVDLIVITR